MREEEEACTRPSYMPNNQVISLTCPAQMTPDGIRTAHPIQNMHCVRGRVPFTLEAVGFPSSLFSQLQRPSVALT